MKVDPLSLPLTHPSRTKPLSEVGAVYRNRVKNVESLQATGKEAGWTNVNPIVGRTSFNALHSILNNPWIDLHDWKVETQ